MPELPEVETTVRLLRGAVVGRGIRDARVHWPRSVGGGGVDAFRRSVVGARVAALERRGKFAVFRLERRGRAAGALLVHLRMSGRLVVEPARSVGGPWARVELRLDRGVLRFLDVRKFGRMTFHADPEAVLGQLGPEPLAEDFSPAAFARTLRDKRRSLKPLLLDQSFLAGLGNIYVDESLHRARLHPLRRSDRVPARQAELLLREIRATLREAIEREGSSFDSFYRTPEGRPGRYQEQFRVYGRSGLPCPACSTLVVRLRVGQRGTHVCPRCQPAPRAARVGSRPP